MVEIHHGHLSFVRIRSLDQRRRRASAPDCEYLLPRRTAVISSHSATLSGLGTLQKNHELTYRQGMD